MCGACAHGTASRTEKNTLSLRAKTPVHARKSSFPPPSSRYQQTRRLSIVSYVCLDDIHETPDRQNLYHDLHFTSRRSGPFNSAMTRTNVFVYRDLLFQGFLNGQSVARHGMFGTEAERHPRHRYYNFVAVIPAEAACFRRRVRESKWRRWIPFIRCLHLRCLTRTLTRIELR